MYILLPPFFGFTNARDFLHTLDGIICPVPLYGIYRPLKFKDMFLLSLLKTSRGSKDAHCFSILVRKRYRTRRTFTVPGLNVHPNWLNLRCWPQEELQECTESGAFAGSWPQCEPLPCSIGGGQAIQICCVDCWNWSSYWNKSYVGDRCMLLKIIFNDKKIWTTWQPFMLKAARQPTSAAWCRHQQLLEPFCWHLGKIELISRCCRHVEKEPQTSQPNLFCLRVLQVGH